MARCDIETFSLDFFSFLYTSSLHAEIQQSVSEDMVCVCVHVCVCEREKHSSALQMTPDLQMKVLQEPLPLSCNVTMLSASAQRHRRRVVILQRWGLPGWASQHLA